MGQQVDHNMTEETDKLQEFSEKTPLEINYVNIYYALKALFPDQVLVILSAIKRIIVIEDDSPAFSTMGITKYGTLYLSRNFWNKHMTSKNRLETVLMHELMHHVSGDVFQLITPEEVEQDPDLELRVQSDHIAMDARINSFSCINRPDIKPEEFFKEFYTEEACQVEFLQKLLKPDSTFTTPEELTLKPFYDKLYKSIELCPHYDLSDAIYEILKKRPKGKKLVVKLVGSHGLGGKELTEEDLKGVSSIEIDMSGISEEELDKIRKEIKKQQDEAKKRPGSEGVSPSPGERLKGAIIDHISEMSSMGHGQGKEIATIFLNQCINITEKFDLNKFKHLAFNNIFHNVRSQARQRVGKYTTSPIIPNRIATNDLILTASGHPLLLWKTHKKVYKIDKNLLPIYLDVSGSTWNYLPEIVRLIANIGSNELDFVWGFSNKVVKHTLDMLQAGKVDSTGGTDFDCIIEHATENEFEHIVVITDGDASCRTSDRIPTLKTVVTILFGYATKNNFFTKVYENTHSMDEVRL